MKSFDYQGGVEPICIHKCNTWYGIFELNDLGGLAEWNMSLVRPKYFGKTGASNYSDDGILQGILKEKISLCFYLMVPDKTFIWLQL